jgi:tetratricopeptide (TPR) repeat protein
VRAGPLRGEIAVRGLVFLPLLLARGIFAQCPARLPASEAAQARFQELERSGREAFQQRDFVGAAQNLRQAVCFAPANARAWHELALAEAASGDFLRADASLTRAERLAPRDFGILLSHAQVQLSLNQPDLARRTLHRAGQLQPTAPQTLGQLYVLLGRTYVEHKQPEAAIAAFLRARLAGPLDVESLLLLATMENSQGAYADAVQDALLVLNSRPAATDGQKGAAAAIAGLAYENQKLQHDAVRMLEAANRLAPTPTSYLALARIHETTGKLSEAIRVLQEARTALPGSTAIAIALGRNLVNAGDARLALDVLTQVTLQSPGELEAWRWLAEARNSLGQAPASIAALKELAGRAPGYPMIDVMIAQAYLKQDPVDYENALRMLERAEKTSPSDPDIFYMRGKIYAEQGRFEDAVGPLRRAIDLTPTAATSYYQLGLVYRKLDRPREAAQQFDRFNFLKGSSE